MEKISYYNSDGKILTIDTALQILSPDFLDENGFPNWDLIAFGDGEGFDLRYIGEEGSHTKTIILPPGKHIIRYGFPTGSYTADLGTPYELLSLPYIKESVPYHEYIVQEECQVECVVKKGIVAPGFGSIGGAVQYKHMHTINTSIELGILKEDYEWIREIEK